MTKKKKGAKRGRPPGSKKQVKSTVSDAIAKSPARSVKPKPNPKLMDCEFCGYKFEADAGRYGCPNCNGEGLPEQGRVGTCIALIAVNSSPSRPAVRTFPIIPTFGDAGAKHDLSIVLENSEYQGFRLLVDNDGIWMETYEG